MKHKYTVYICSGDGKNRRESGGYEALGTSYQEAALNFSLHWNNTRFPSMLPKYGYGLKWRKVERRKGNPKCHSYLKNERNQKLLLIKR